MRHPGVNIPTRTRSPRLARGIITFRALLILTLAAAACAFATVGPVAAQAETPSPDHLFDFLIGDWRIDNWFVQEDGTKVTGTARMTARRTLGGAGVETRAEHPGKDGAPSFYATATYVFNERLGKWIGAGINSLGNAKQYEAGLRDGKVIVTQSGMLFEGRPGINRVPYHDISKNGFKNLFEHSSDDGATWVTEYGVTARRAGKK